MTAPLPDQTPPKEDGGDRLEAVLAKFRQDCAAKGPPAIADLRGYLEGTSVEVRPELLISLVAEHLKRTWDGRQGCLLEEYSTAYGGEFRDLETLSSIPDDLVDAEFLARYAFPNGDGPDVAEYARRFADRPDVLGMLERHCRDGGRYVLIREVGRGGLGLV